MKLKDQVCSLELAKKLKELGVKQDYKVGDWCYEDVGERLLLVTYVRDDSVDVVFPYASKTDWHDNSDLEMRHSLIKTFTVAELGEMLPKDNLKMGIFYNNWRIEYDVPNGYAVSAETEADARAKCLIWLIEQGYIKYA